MTQQRKPAKDPFALRAIRFSFTILKTVAPPIANRWAFKLFITPYRYPLPQRERLLKERAEHFTFQHDGLKLQAYSWGDGPIALFMHGWAGRGLQCSEMVQPLLDQGFRVVAFDAQAHGKSEGKTTNLLLMADALRALTDEIGPIHTLIGHSLGGAIGLLAINKGLPAKRIITISTPSVGEGIITEFMRRINGNVKTGKYLRKRVLQLTGQPFDEFTAETSAKALPNDFPFLIIHDENDREAQFYHAEAMKSVAPNALMHKSSGLGHTRILRDSAVVDSIVNFAIAQNVPVLA